MAEVAIMLWQAATESNNRIHQYFAQHPEFDYHPDAPFLREFGRLIREQKWGNNQVRLNLERQAIRDAMVAQFNTMYGKREDDLGSWQKLCEALGIDPIPDTISKCRRILKKTHVNLVDFVQRPNPEKPVPTFESEAALRKYSRKHKKIFPKDNVNEGSLLRCLLRRIGKGA